MRYDNEFGRIPDTSKAILNSVQRCFVTETLVAIVSSGGLVYRSVRFDVFVLHFSF